MEKRKTTGLNLTMPRLQSRKLLITVCLAIGLVLLCGSYTLAAQSGTKKASSGLECHKNAAKVAVHCVASGLGAILKNVKSDKERIRLIRAFIDPIRFYPDKSGYFYVYDFKCTNIAHAIQKNLQDKTFENYQDSRSKFVIRALCAAAKKGGGFVEYYWVKPGEKKEQQKLGYVEPIPNTTYFIGTGVYLSEK